MEKLTQIFYSCKDFLTKKFNIIRNISESDKEKITSYFRKTLKLIAGLLVIHRILKIFNINIFDEFTNTNEQISSDLESPKPSSIWLDTDGDGFNDTELRDINNDGTYGTLEDELNDNYKKQMGLK